MCRMYSFNVLQSEMAAPRANFIVLLLFSLSPLTQCLLDCFIDNEECEIHEGNLVQTIMGISSMTECAGLCEDERYCTTFTFFEAGSHPLNEACLLFSSCPKRKSCQGCVTGSSQDSCTCSVKFDGDITADNFFDIVPDVSDELACKRNCANNANCSIYTYYNSSDNVNPEVCFLLGDNPSGGLRRPVLSCETCSSGPAR